LIVVGGMPSLAIQITHNLFVFVLHDDCKAVCILDLYQPLPARRLNQGSNSGSAFQAQASAVSADRRLGTGEKLLVCGARL